MYYSNRLSLLIAIFLFSGSIVYGQGTTSVNEEIRLTVTSSDVVTVVVRNEETATTVHTGSANQNDPWTADTDDETQGGVDADLAERILYKLSFTSGSFSADYLYYYCPNRDAQSD